MARCVHTWVVNKETFQCPVEAYEGTPECPAATMCVEHEIKKLRASEKSWKKYSESLCHSLGHGIWRHYYRGANDAKNDKVFDPEYGRKFHLYEDPRY